jgi:hypothetical protein
VGAALVILSVASLGILHQTRIQLQGLEIERNLSSVWISRHEKSCDLGDPGLRKILQIVEDFNKITNNFCRKAVQPLEYSPNKQIKVTATINRIL